MVLFFINNMDILSLSRKDLSRIIALVPQNPFLIAGTILENICYGLEQQPSDKEVKEALTKANLYDFVNSLPEGIHTKISEGGK